MLYRLVHQLLSAIQINRVYAFQGDVCITRIGLIVGTLKSVRVIEVSSFQGCPQGGVSLYIPPPLSATRSLIWSMHVPC